MDRFVEMQIVTKRSTPIRDRETLAEAAHRKKCAKHKGRNHWRNWERRQMAKAKRDASAIGVKKRDAAFGAYNREVAAYWQGIRADLPARPSL